MRKTIIILTVLVPLAATAQPDAYEPIFQITGENPTSYIGYFIANCTDQDGDGSDELLLANEENEILMFYGGDDIDTIPDMVFSEDYGFIINLAYKEAIVSQEFGSILISYYTSGFGLGRIYLYNCGEELDTIYDNYFVYEQFGDGFGGHLALGDVNGDGWNDIVTSAAGYDPGGDFNGKLYVYFGGEDMDNVADFTITADYNNFGSGLGGSLACGDVNGDGYADILTMTSSRIAWLFCGGTELDSIPDWSYQAESPAYLTGGCTVIPSLNADQFSDIILKEMGGNTCVFFGGEVLSDIPDQAIYTSVGLPIFAGDLNGDGYDDLFGKSQAYTLVRPLYGGPSGIEFGTIIDTDGTPMSVGNCGDVNGDGFNDLAFSLREPEYYGQAFVYADTTLTSVNRRPSTINRTFTLHPNYPNPFNAQTTIPFTLDRAGKVTLTVYDVLGRSVGVQYIEPLQAGTHEFVWNAEGMASGVYLVRLELQSAGTLQHEVRKMVLVK